jgi:hypothetical protein
MPWAASTQTQATQTTPAVTPPQIAAGAVIRSISGTGVQKVGSLSQARTIVLEWQVAKPPFQLLLPNGFLLVSSQARTGRVRLLPGKYPVVRVVTNGRWTLALRAAS